MYLIINEDNSLIRTEVLTADDFVNCDDGIMTIIDFDTQKEYYNGEWLDITLIER